MSDRLKALVGLEATRAGGKSLLDRELFATSDQLRFFIHNPASESGGGDVMIGPNYHLGDVADESERNGLHTATGNPFGCWPGDTAKQTDVNSIYLCISNNGESNSDWELFAAVTAGGNIAQRTIDNTDSPYSSLTTDEAIACDDTAGSITINLPAAASNAGKVYRVTKISSASNTVTVDANGSETISGALTQVISAQWTSMSFYSDGTNWIII